MNEDQEDPRLVHEMKHLMASMRVTGPKSFAELCELLGVDPADFGQFVARDAKKQDS